MEGEFMDIAYPVLKQTASPAYVLSVLQDQHRQACQYDPEVDRSAILMFDTTVAQWRDACDLLGWQELGWAYNQYFEISCTDDQWYSALEPAKERTLRDVCKLISKYAMRPRIQPARLLGSPCDTAGAFLTIRSMLHDDGAIANEISPSTELASYTRRHCQVFVSKLSRLAPGALPDVRISTPVYDFFVYLLTAALIGGLISGFGESPVGLACSILVGLFSYFSVNFAARHILPESVEFGDLRTFRDLAIAIADGDKKLRDC
jgi:hypothetical protein